MVAMSARTAGALLFAAIAVARLDGGVGARAAGAGDKASIAVAVRDGRVSLEAQDAPLAQVFGALAKRAGFSLDVRGDLVGSVSESFDGLRPAAAIRRLAGRNSYVIEFAHAADGSLRVKRVLVIAREAKVRMRARDRGQRRSRAVRTRRNRR